MTDELRRLANDLGKIPSKALPKVDEVLKKGAQNIADGLNENLAASTHFKGAAGSVNYDQSYGIGRASYEVGPDKGRRGGALANVAFFGTSRGGGTVDIDGPIRAEEAALPEFLGKAIEGLL